MTGLDFDLGPGAAALRQQLRDLVHEQVPADFLGAFTDDPADLETAQRFCRLLADRGLLCVAWPEEFGGRGASAQEQTVVREEMWAHHEPRGAQYMGVNWVGPAIMRFGTAEQQALHLPAIAAGDVIWCQGFSEPDAGSDLASLATRATPDPAGGWRISQIQPVTLDVGDGAGALTVNRAIIQKGNEKALVYYWFQGRGRIEANEFAVKLHLMSDAMLRQRTDGALVRLVTPILANEQVAASEQRLQSFLTKLRPQLMPYLPD